MVTLFIVALYIVACFRLQSVLEGCLTSQKQQPASFVITAAATATVNSCGTDMTPSEAQHTAAAYKQGSCHTQGCQIRATQLWRQREAHQEMKPHTCDMVPNSISPRKYMGAVMNAGARMVA